MSTILEMTGPLSILDLLEANPDFELCISTKAEKLSAKRISPEADEPPLLPLVPEANGDEGFDEFYRNILNRLAPLDDTASLPFVPTVFSHCPGF